MIGFIRLVGTNIGNAELNKLGVPGKFWIPLSKRFRITEFGEYIFGVLLFSMFAAGAFKKASLSFHHAPFG